MNMNQDMDREKKRLKYILPILLIDEDTKMHFKAIILDISSKGLRVFTNDKRILMVKEDILKSKVFKLEFDFFDIDTSELTGKVTNVTEGVNEKYERQMGIAFESIPKLVAMELDEFVYKNMDDLFL